MKLGKKGLIILIGTILGIALITWAVLVSGIFQKKDEPAPKEEEKLAEKPVQNETTPEVKEKEPAKYVMPDVRGIYYADAVSMIEEGLEKAGFKNYTVNYCWSWSNYDPEMNACILNSDPAAGTVLVDNGEQVSVVLTAAEQAPTPNLPEEPEKVLVVVFSATGNTKRVAEMIAKIEDADLYEIIPAVPYTEEDINYSNYSCRALKEQGDASARPAIGSDPIDLSEYTKIYVGYPIWAGNEPRIMDTFAESYDFGSAVVIPFCTSGSSGIGATGTKLANLAGSGSWQTGRRFPGTATEADVQNWIDSMK